MRKGRQRWDIVVVGDVGYDAYLLPESKCVMRPAGSAFNIGCGLAASRASGTLIAHVPARFNRTAFDIFKRTDVTIQEHPLDPLFDQLYLFDFRKGPTDEPSFLATSPVTAIQYDALNDLLFSKYIVHVGTMQPTKAIAAVEMIANRNRAAIVSANLYFEYLRQDPSACSELLNKCTIVFLNQKELEIAINTLGNRALCDGRMLIVTAGQSGATLIVDGVPVLHYVPRPVKSACSVGAGDVLIGAFLGAFSRSRDPSVALAFACEVASRSTADYGVTRCLDALGEFRELDDVRDLIGPPSLAVATFIDDRLVVSDIAADETYIEATGVFVVRDEELLLVEKRPDSQMASAILYVPGGKVQSGESPAECAQRELKEETTLEANALQPLSVFSYRDAARGRVYKFHQFLVTPDEGKGVPGGDVSAIRWVPFSKLDRTALFDLTWAQYTLLRIGEFI